MRPRTRTLLVDVLSAAMRIEKFVADRTYTDYLDDELLRSAVERQFIIVGEALRALALSDPATAAQVADARRIIDFRNVLVHGYAGIVPSVVWDAISVGLPVLRAEVEALLGED